jgi:hypothetical protein
VRELHRQESFVTIMPFSQQAQKITTQLQRSAHGRNRKPGRRRGASGRGRKTLPIAEPAYNLQLSQSGRLMTVFVIIPDAMVSAT